MQLRRYHLAGADRLSQTSARGGGTLDPQCWASGPLQILRGIATAIVSTVSAPPRHSSHCCCRDHLISSRNEPFCRPRRHRAAQRRHCQCGPLIIPATTAVVSPPPSTSLPRRPNSPCPVSTTWRPNWQSRGTPSHPSWTVSVDRACPWTSIAWICTGRSRTRTAATHRGSDPSPLLGPPS
jgi:hypothetical protein